VHLTAAACTGALTSPALCRRTPFQAARAALCITFADALTVALSLAATRLYKNVETNVHQPTGSCKAAVIFFFP
jgi:hypothetical protein